MPNTVPNHEHLAVQNGDRIVCTHCELDLPEPTITIEIVPESTCPRCGGGDEFFNRPKVALEDGVWWWRCYNTACPVGYYEPITGEVELTPRT